MKPSDLLHAQALIAAADRGEGRKAIKLVVDYLRAEVATYREAAARDFALAAEWKETAERYRVEAAIARDRAENPNK